MIGGHVRRDPGPDVAGASFAVELRDVGKRFGSVVALDGVDLAIRKVKGAA